MKKVFYSNGKLLLTAEYVVLDGAKALALPTKKGQSLEVATNESSILHWQSFDCYKKIWYETKIETARFFEGKAPKGNSKYDTVLFKILWEAQQKNPFFLDSNKGYCIQTYLSFERLWGLGTSSTLINNIAQWANVNAFLLLQNSFGGSGYDIACAQKNSALFFKNNEDKSNPEIASVSFNPLFSNKLFFVYLEEKKDSKKAIKNYRNQSIENLNEVINKINTITYKVSICTDFNFFEKLLTEHEALIASLLKTTTVKQDRFNDYSGVVKSLGGWGGDFVLATGTVNDMVYFTQKGYKTIVPYNEMVL